MAQEADSWGYYGACVQGAHKWHLCSGAGGGRVHSTHTSPRLLSLFPAGLRFGISFGAGPECQEMLPTLSLPSRGS